MIVPAPVSIEAFTIGCSLIASTTAFAMNDRNVRLKPSLSANGVLYRFRRTTTWLMSTSITVVNWAVVLIDSSIRSAITRRSRLIDSIRPRCPSRVLRAKADAPSA